MIIRPATLREANDLVARWHRHSKPVRGHRFSLAAVEGDVVGIAIVGRPVAAELQKVPLTAEITRVCTNGHPNACSKLYAACRNVWRAMGGHRLVTYTLASEPGTSLKAAGFHIEAHLPARANWNTDKRPRPNNTEPCPARIRWAA